MKRELKASTVLRRALKVIEGGWTQGTFAKTRDGRKTDISSPKAARFCALGALRKVTTDRSEEVRLSARTHLESAAGAYCSVASWNDDPKRKKSEVVAAFRKAIELARADERSVTL